MDAHENLFYGLGIIAYSVAYADGSIQPEEHNALKQIVQDWAEQLDEDFDVTSIIFFILGKSKPVFAEGYEEGMHHIRLGDQFLTPKLKEKFVRLIGLVAKAFPPVTQDEAEIISKFENDLAPL